MSGGARDPKVRRATHADLATLRSVRLEAMTETPNAFGSTLEREIEWTPDDWARWIDGLATFLLDAGDVARGLVAATPHRENERAVFLEAMWVHPAFRGSGAGDALIQALVGWAKTNGYEEVWLEVLEDDPRARRIYERNGFRPTGRTAPRPRDGAPEIEMKRSTSIRVP